MKTTYMKKNAKWIGLLPMIMWGLLLSGCHSQRPISNINKQRNEQLAPLATPYRDVTTLTAKTNIAIDYNGHAVTVRGKLRMRRDEVVQMTLTALGVVEIAFVEFTPQGAYIIDRINKRYTLLDYSSGLFNSAGINFSTIQGLFWNRIFIPGEKEVWKQLNKFRIVALDNRQLIEPERQSLLKCHFYTDSEYKQLQQTKLNLQHYEAVWQYGIFHTIGTHDFPTIFDISLNGSSRSIAAHIALNNLSASDTQWKSGTNLSNYKKVELEQLLSIIDLFS